MNNNDSMLIDESSSISDKGKDERKAIVSKIDDRPFVSVRDIEFYRDITDNDLKYKIRDLVSELTRDDDICRKR